MQLTEKLCVKNRNDVSFDYDEENDITVEMDIDARHADMFLIRVKLRRN